MICIDKNSDISISSQLSLMWQLNRSELDIILLSYIGKVFKKWLNVPDKLTKTNAIIN